MFIGNRFFHFSPLTYFNDDATQENAQHTNVDTHSDEHSNEYSSNEDTQSDDLYSDSWPVNTYRNEVPENWHAWPQEQKTQHVRALISDFTEEMEQKAKQSNQLPEGWENWTQRKKTHYVREKIQAFHQKVIHQESMKKEEVSCANMTPEELIYSLPINSKEAYQCWSMLTPEQKKAYTHANISNFEQYAIEILEYQQQNKAAEPSDCMVNLIWGISLPVTLPLSIVLKVLDKFPVKRLTSAVLRFTERNPRISFAMSLVLVFLYLGSQGVAAHKEVTDAQSAAQVAKNNAEAESSSHAIHSSTLEKAKEAHSAGETEFTTLALFKNQTCAEDAQKVIFNTQDVQDKLQFPIHWEACFEDDQQCGMIATLNRTEFARAIGHTVAKGKNCIETLSIDPLNFAKTKQNIHQQAQARALQEKLKAPLNQTQACVATSSNISTIMNPYGQAIPISQSVECRPVARIYQEPSTKILTSNLGKLANTICIKRMAIISDGVAGKDIDKHVVTTSTFGQPQQKNESISCIETTNSSLPLEESSHASSLARSLLKRCSNLQFDDIRAAEVVTTTQSSSSLNSTMLSVTNVIQSLSHILNTEKSELPQSVLLFDIHEAAGYLPDISLVETLVTKLNDLGIDVYAYDPSPGSWLSDIKGVQHANANSIGQMVARTVRVKRSLPDPVATTMPSVVTDNSQNSADVSIKSIPDTSLSPLSILAPLGVVVAGAIAVGACLTCKFARKKTPQIPQFAEEIPLQTKRLQEDEERNETDLLNPMPEDESEEFYDASDNSIPPIIFHSQNSSTSSLSGSIRFGAVRHADSLTALNEIQVKDQDEWRILDEQSSQSSDSQAITRRIRHFDWKASD